MGFKEKWRQALYRIRNPERGEQEREFLQQLGFKRLLILIPFLLAVLVIGLLSLKG